MVPNRVLFCELFIQFFLILPQKYMEVVLSDPIKNPMKCCVDCSGFFVVVPFTMLFSTELSFATGVGCFG